MQGDIIVAALGKPEFVTADMVKDGAVVIDVGITREPDATKKTGFKLKGDVDFETVCSQMFLDNTGAGWCRAYDDCCLVEKYFSGVQSKKLSEVFNCLIV